MWASISIFSTSFYCKVSAKGNFQGAHCKVEVGTQGEEREKEI